MLVKALRLCRWRVHFAKSLVFSKVRMFYGALSTDFSTALGGNVSKWLREEHHNRSTGLDLVPRQATHRKIGGNLF